MGRGSSSGGGAMGGMVNKVNSMAHPQQQQSALVPSASATLAPQAQGTQHAAPLNAPAVAGIGANFAQGASYDAPQAAAPAAPAAQGMMPAAPFAAPMMGGGANAMRRRPDRREYEAGLAPMQAM